MPFFGLLWPFLNLTMVIFSFTDYLVSRDIETSAQGNQLKYDIVSKLVDSSSEAIDAPDMNRLKLYKRQGVYFKEKDPEIATEEM